VSALDAWKGVVLKSDEEELDALDMVTVGQEVASGRGGEQVVVKLVQKAEGGWEWSLGGLKRHGWKEGNEVNAREGWPVL